MDKSPAEVAKILGVDGDTVKKLAYRFRSYLSAPANPPKHVTRRFSRSDIHVLAYVLFHWEDEPDMQNIEAGLNCGNYEDESIDQAINMSLPIFQDVPEDLDGTCQRGALIGGEIDELYRDLYLLAGSYKLAGDTLADASMTSHEAHELLYPVLFNYRHAIELYLKAIVRPKATVKHNLAALHGKLARILTEQFATNIPDWFADVIETFSDFDNDSATFRYGDNGIVSHRTGKGGEFFVYVPHLKERMALMENAFQRIVMALPRRARGI